MLKKEAQIRLQVRCGEPGGELISKETERFSVRRVFAAANLTDSGLRKPKLFDPNSSI